MSARSGRILVVDDEVNLAEGIRENLEEEGYQVAVAHDGPSGLVRILANDLDLVILDVMMPGLDGYSVCQEVRKEKLDLPILFLTARGGVNDRIRGFEAGGDDYLAKPFHLKELLLRVEAILRRRLWYSQAQTENRILRFGDNEVDFLAYRARSFDGNEHSLTHKEAMILKVLAEQEGEVVPRERILDKVWGYDLYPSTRTIDNFIVRLRRRFEANPEAPLHLHTIRGVGYRFTLNPERSE